MSTSGELLLGVVLFVVAGVITGALIGLVAALMRREAPPRPTGTPQHRRYQAPPPAGTTAPRVNRYGELDEP